MSIYAGLNTLPEGAHKQVTKLLMDRLANLEKLAAGIGGVTQPLAAPLDSGGNRLTAVADPTAKTDAVTLQYLQKYVDAAIALDKQVAAIPPVVPPNTPTGPPAFPAPAPGPGLTCYVDTTVGQPAGIPAAPNKRWFRGDFCGVTVPGLPAVTGGASDPSVVLSWFLDRYSPANQALIFAAHHVNGYTHFKLSWPDSRDGNGQSIAQFVGTCQLVQANGFYPVVFLTSKVYDGKDPAPASLDAIMAALIAGACIPIASVGWELDLFNTPGATLQTLITHVTNTLVPTGCNVYVHFSPGYVAWQAPGDLGSAFWIANAGKLTGLLHQADPAWDCGYYQAKLADLQVRFGLGAAGWPTDSGLGHPFDIVADEYSASARFAGSLSEAAAKQMGLQAISSPAPGGGPAPIPVMGFNNGGPAV